VLVTLPAKVAAPVEVSVRAVPSTLFTKVKPFPVTPVDALQVPA
jgi:hypothetical protein